jgi:urease accessory protein UreF
MASATKNFHLPLPEALYRELRDAAESVGQPATRLAQELVRRGLDQLRRVRQRQAIARYATAVAGTPADLDQDLEAAALEGWRDLE